MSKEIQQKFYRLEVRHQKEMAIDDWITRLKLEDDYWFDYMNLVHGGKGAERSRD